MKEKEPSQKSIPFFEGFRPTSEGTDQLLALCSWLKAGGLRPHALLLTGDGGRVRHLAQLLTYHILTLDASWPGDRILKDQCPDLLVETEGAIPIDRVRELIRLMYRRPLQGRYKVFYLAQAEQLGIPSQNALLKSLEEPPAHMIWLLGAQNAAALLPTIRSRCQWIRLGYDPVMAEEEACCRLLTRCLMGQGPAVFMARSLLDPWRADYRPLLTCWLYYLNFLLAEKAGGAHAPDASPESLHWAKEMAEKCSFEQISEALEAVEQVRQGLDQNWHPQLALEKLCLRLSGK